MKTIAKVYNGFSTKFGIPRQSGYIKSIKSTIIFEKEFRNKDFIRGLEEFSHIWLLWQFSENKDKKVSATVKPPRLGGNQKMGVFATRSPFRPNPIGLSCVVLESIEITQEFGPMLHISGADLMNETPIYDIKPYISYTDCQPEAVCGFADKVRENNLEVEIPLKWKEMIPKEHLESVIAILKEDPRPGYHKEGNRIYGFEYAGMDIRFTVEDNKAIVCEVIYIDEKKQKYDVRYKL